MQFQSFFFQCDAVWIAALRPAYFIRIYIGYYTMPFYVHRSWPLLHIRHIRSMKPFRKYAQIERNGFRCFFPIQLNATPNFVGKIRPLFVRSKFKMAVELANTVKVGRSHVRSYFLKIVRFNYSPKSRFCGNIRLSIHHNSTENAIENNSFAI